MRIFWEKMENISSYLFWKNLDKLWQIFWENFYEFWKGYVKKRKDYCINFRWNFWANYVKILGKCQGKLIKHLRKFQENLEKICEFLKYQNTLRKTENAYDFYFLKISENYPSIPWKSTNKC